MRIFRSTWSTNIARLALFLTVIGFTSGCASISFDVPRSESTYMNDTDQTELGKWTVQWVVAHDGSSGFYPLAGGMDALAARIGLAERAQKSIDLQYFLMKEDKAGLVLSKSLLLAADRGVRIRVLLDDIFTSASDRKLVLLNEQPPAVRNADRSGLSASRECATAADLSAKSAQS
jgi:putative cardiolipin synthase